jgi:hypothetical protein
LRSGWLCARDFDAASEVGECGAKLCCISDDDRRQLAFAEESRGNALEIGGGHSVHGALVC